MPAISNDAWIWAKSFAGIDWETGIYVGDYFIRDQFTGLLDCKGMEIYEGDLIQAESHGKNTYEIRFIEGGFCAYQEALKGFPIDINHFYPSGGPDIEVIGNIYESTTPTERVKEEKE